MKSKGLFYLIIVMLLSCGKEVRTEEVWELDIPKIGAIGSPGAIDLNDDGVLDIVIGGSPKEFISSPHGVMALDGKSGTMLWQTPNRNQIVGSPQFLFINGDKIPDIVIGGRSAQLLGLDGKNGEILWEYLPTDTITDYINDTTILNFYTPQLINDELFDDPKILTAYGGFVKAQRGDERPVGYLMLLDAKTGGVEIKMPMPDGKETYMSPIIHKNASGEAQIIFGTGGEYIHGNLYMISLNDFAEKAYGSTKLLAEGRGKGFIAPPVLADINLDGTKDIVINSVDGRLLAIDGQAQKLLWSFEFETSYDVYTMPAPGLFTAGDKVPDFFCSYGYGPWPDTEYTINFLIDGSDGAIVFKDTLGKFQYASPVSFDLESDGTDEVFVVANDRKTSNLAGANMEFLVNQLFLYNTKTKKKAPFLAEELGSNLGASPLLTDINHDQKLDIIIAFMSDPVNFYSFENLKIKRIATNIDIKGPINWGQYMGPDLKSRYVNNK